MERLKIVIADFDANVREQVAKLAYNVARQGKVKVDVFFIQMARPTPSVIGIYGEQCKARRRLQEMLYTCLTRRGRQFCKIALKAADTRTAVLSQLNDATQFVLHVDATVPDHFKLAAANPRSGAVSGLELQPEPKTGANVLVGLEEPPRLWASPRAWLCFALIIAATMGALAALV